MRLPPVPAAFWTTYLTLVTLSLEKTKMQNDSGLHPAGRAVLVKPYQPEIKQGTIIIPDAVMANQQVLEQRAIVIEIGNSAWLEEKIGRAHVGDKVLVSA